MGPPSIILHHFQSSCTQSPDLPDVSTLQDLAGNLISYSAWHNPSAVLSQNMRLLLISDTDPIEGVHKSTDASRNITYIYKADLPTLPKCVPPPPSPWQNNHLTLPNREDLEEFQNSNFSHQISSVFMSQYLFSWRHKRMTLPTLKDGVLDLLPSPHLHPSPIVRKQPTFSGSEYPALSPILPHTTLESPSEWSKRAWAIPVQGELPWKVSSAIVIDHSMSLPLPCDEFNDQIAWTPSALLQFWEFLLTLRKTQTMGQIGISFRPAFPTGEESFDGTNRTRPGLTARPFGKVSYIHISLLGHRALYFRRILDDWVYKYHPSSASRQIEMRLLSKAKFALVDEISKGVLIA